MWKIYAPVKDANGVWASVRFVNGVGETNNPALMEWFRKHHYRIEKYDNSVQNPIEKCEISVETPSEKCEEVIEERSVDVTETLGEPDFDAMTPNELRDWAKANGFGGVIKNTRNKEKLLELIRG